MEDPRAPASARVAAAKEILDRGWGKSQSSVSLTTVPSTEDIATANYLHSEMVRHIELQELTRQNKCLPNEGSSR
jgi:hypothetical protein